MPGKGDLAAMERGGGFADLADRILQKFAGLVPEGPRRAGNPDIVRDHVLRAPGLENGDADNCRIHRRDTPRHDSLKRLDDGRTAGDRVEGHVRLRGMAATAGDDHREFIGIGHADTIMDAGLPGLHRRPVMHAPDGFHLEITKQPVLDHREAAATALFGRLENEIDGAVEIARLGEILRRAKKHRGVPVMTAGMHPPWSLRGVRKLVQLLHRQRVYIGAKPDSAGRVPAAAQHADNACLAHATVNLDPETLKLRGDEVRRPDLLVADLGMLVQFTPPAAQLVGAVGDGIDHGHGVWPVCLFTVDGPHVRAVACQGQAVSPEP